MSFGFGVGDFLAVFELASKIRKEFAGAPRQFKDISAEYVTRAGGPAIANSRIDRVRSLAIVIQDVDVALSGCEPDAQQKADIREIAGSCHKVLVDIEKTLNQYGKLQTRGGNLGDRVKRAWEKLRWEPDDIRELRGRITSNVTLLGAYIGRIYRYSLTPPWGCVPNTELLEQPSSACDEGGSGSSQRAARRPRAAYCSRLAHSN